MLGNRKISNKSLQSEEASSIKKMNQDFASVLDSSPRNSVKRNSKTIHLKRRRPNHSIGGNAPNQSIFKLASKTEIQNYKTPIKERRYPVIRYPLLLDCLT
jgi:hypothetical protein